MPDAGEHKEGKSRRDVLKALGAAAAGAVAGGMLKADQAQAHHGTINATSNSDTVPAIHGDNNANGPGVVGETEDGVGVVGAANGTNGVGVEAAGGEGIGLLANGGQLAGIMRGVERGLVVSGGEFGVDAGARYSYGAGVRGTSGTIPEGRTSPDGTGVLGEASGLGTGVRAKANQDTATALEVIGKAKFSTTGNGTIPAGQDSASVNTLAVTALSHITVTLTGDPGQASSAPGSKPVLVWVERQPGTGFVAHLSRPVRVATPFTYLIVEPV